LLHLLHRDLIDISVEAAEFACDVIFDQSVLRLSFAASSRIGSSRESMKMGDSEKAEIIGSLKI
jgi:hypothetical protein